MNKLNDDNIDTLMRIGFIITILVFVICGIVSLVSVAWAAVIFGIWALLVYGVVYELFHVPEKSPMEKYDMKAKIPSQHCESWVEK